MAPGADRRPSVDGLVLRSLLAREPGATRARIVTERPRSEKSSTLMPSEISQTRQTEPTRHMLSSAAVNIRTETEAPMGFLRKTAFVASGGATGLLFKANSKKERTANALEKQNRLLQGSMQAPSKSTAPAKHTFRTANYDGRAPWHQAPEASGTLLLEGDRWEMHFRGTKTYMHGPLGRYFMSAAASGPKSCHITVVDKQDEKVKWSFDLPKTSSKTFVASINTHPVTWSPARSNRPTLHLGIADEIEKLAQLRGQGLLTDVEFETQKRKLLGTS